MWCDDNRIALIRNLLGKQKYNFQGSGLALSPRFDLTAGCPRSRALLLYTLPLLMMPQLFIHYSRNPKGYLHKEIFSYGYGHTEILAGTTTSFLWISIDSIKYSLQLTSFNKRVIIFFDI